MDEKQNANIRILKCGNRTYYFDVKTAKNNSQFLVISESSFDKKTQARKRNSFILFKEDLIRFTEMLKTIELVEIK